MKTLHFKILSLLLLIAMLFINQSFSQGIQFQKRYLSGTKSYFPSCIINTTDGGYVLAGQMYDTVTYVKSAFGLKIDYLGNIVWAKMYDGVSDDNFYSVCELANGDFVFAGDTYSYSSPPNWDMFLIHSNNLGTPIWTKTISYLGASGASSIKPTSDGGIIIAGGALDTNGKKGAMIKLDGNGNIIWSKRYGNPFYGKEPARDVIQTSDGGFAYVGWTFSYGAGSSDVYLVRTDTLGNISWTKTFGGSQMDYGNSLLQTSDGGFIIAGITETFSPDYLPDLYIVKTDLNGNLLWSKNYGNTTYQIEGISIVKASDGGYTILGQTIEDPSGLSDYMLLKIDSLGTSSWTRKYDYDYNYSTSLKNTNFDGYIMAGSAQTLSSQSKIYVVKTDNNGVSGCKETLISLTALNSATIVGTGGIATDFGTISEQTPSVTELTISDSTLCLTIGIGEIENENYILIYPNPSNGIFIIESILTKGEIRIYNALGEEIWKTTMTNKKSTVDFSEQNSGIYFIQIISEGKLITKKIIKE